MTELLFTYGTLRQPGVQRDVFGRQLDGRPDAIVGYDLDAAIEGAVFAISAAELAAADDYEVDDYQRIAVPLRSRLGLRVRQPMNHQRLSWQKAVVGPVFCTAS